MKNLCKEAKQLLDEATEKIKNETNQIYLYV